MNLNIEYLELNHPLLALAPVRYAHSAQLAFSRAQHTSPIDASVCLNDVLSPATVTWNAFVALSAPDVVDPHRLTEDAAEAVAITYAHAQAQWRIFRRCRRGEYADWLLRSPSGDRYAALEISGIAVESVATMKSRLDEKTSQVEKSLAAPEKLAVVVGFSGVSIFARSR